MYVDFRPTEVQSNLKDKRITILFSGTIDPSTINVDTVSLCHRDSKVLFDYDLDVIQSEVRITLKDYLVPNEKYLLKVQNVRNLSDEMIVSPLSRIVTFKSTIIQTVKIINPTFHQETSSLKIKLEEEYDKEPIGRYLIQLSADVNFYTDLKEIVSTDTEIQIEDLEKGKQYFVRARCETETDYGAWSEKVPFIFSDKDKQDETYIPTVPKDDEDFPVTTPVEDNSPVFIDTMNIISSPRPNKTPQSFIFVFSDAVSEDIKIDVYIGETEIIPSEFEIVENRVTVSLVGEEIEDNTTYIVKFSNVKSKDGSKEMANTSCEIVTAMSPLYTSIENVKHIIGDDYSDVDILYAIREASIAADYIENIFNLTVQYVKPKELELKIYAKSQYVLYKASYELLLSHYLIQTASAGTKGKLGDIEWEISDGLADNLKNLLDLLQAKIKYWEDAILGYYDVRATMKTGVKSSTNQSYRNTIKANQIPNYNSRGYDFFNR